MTQQILRAASKVGYSTLAFVSAFAVLWPASHAVAQEAPVAIPVPDMVVDFIECVPLALLIALIVDIMRLGVPWLSRKRMAGDESYNGPKNALRVISVLIGALFGALGYASSMGDGSNPRQLGGIAAGCVAALFGGQLMGAVADRIKALRSKP